jgi:diaminopimelate decarboxylase
MVADVALSEPEVGDLIAMPVTGAYAYTMANNYNGALIAPIVFCADGDSTLVAERQTYEDLLRPHLPALNRQW